MTKELERTPLKTTWGHVILRGKLKLKDDVFTKGQTITVGNETFNGLQSSKPAKDGSIGPWKRVDLNIGIDVGGRTEYFRLNQGAHFIDGKIGMKTKDGFNEIIFKRKLQDKDDKEIKHEVEIPWSQRHQEPYASNMNRLSGNFYNFRLSRNDEGELEHKKFFHLFDAYDYLKDNLKSGMEVEVRGQYEYQYYQEKQQSSIMVTSIVIPFEKTDDDGQPIPFKYGMTVEQDVIIDSESFRWSNIKDNKLTVDGRVTAWMSKDEKGNAVNANVPYNFPFTIQFKDAEDAKMKKAYYEDWFKVKRKNIRLITLLLEGAGGAKKEEIDIDNLPPKTKFMLDNGIITLESLKGGVLNSNFTRELIFKQPKLTLDEDGIPQIQMEDEWCEPQDLEITFTSKQAEVKEEPKSESKVNPAFEGMSISNGIEDDKVESDTKALLEQQTVDSPLW